MIRKSIVMDEELWNDLKIFTEIHKNSISSVIRNAVKTYLEENTKEDLAYKMRTLTPFVDNEEQEELEKVLKNLTPDHFETGEIIKLWLMNLDYLNQHPNF